MISTSGIGAPEIYPKGLKPATFFMGLIGTAKAMP